MRILRGVDASTLWLFEDNAIAAANLRKEAVARGVSAERLVFARRMPLADHLARHRRDLDEPLDGIAAEAAILPAGDREPPAAELVVDLLDERSNGPVPVSRLDPHLRLGGRHVVGPRVFREGVVAEIAGIALGVDGEELRPLAEDAAGPLAEHRMAEIDHDHEVVVGHVLHQRLADGLVLLGREGGVVDLVDLQELEKEVVLHEPPLDDRGGVLPVEEDPPDVWLELALDERLVGVFRAELREHRHLIAEAGHVVGRREDAAGELFARKPLDDHRRLLRRLADRLAIDVFVDDRLPDEQDLQAPGLVEVVEHLARRVSPGEVRQVGLHLRRERAHVLVDEPRRAEGVAAGEGQPAADALHRLLLFEDLAGHVLRLLGVVRALHVDIGLQEPDRLDGRRMRVDRHEVDAPEPGEHLGPELLGEGRPVGPLVDVSVGRERDDEHVAHRLGLLEVAEVAHVEQVEHPVAVHDPAALTAEAGKGRGKFRERNDLGAGGHSEVWSEKGTLSELYRRPGRD